MNRKWLKLGIVALVIAALALAAIAVSAQNTTTGSDTSLIAVAANTLGITQADLIAELNAGKTIADVAKEKDVDVNKIVDAYVAPQAERWTNLVTIKRLTQAQADTLLANFKSNVLLQLSQPFQANASGMMGRGGMGMMGCQGMGMMGCQGSMGTMGANGSTGMMGPYGGMGRMGPRGGMGTMGPYGSGMGFMDANGNGICDHSPLDQSST